MNYYAELTLQKLAKTVSILHNENLYIIITNFIREFWFWFWFALFLVDDFFVFVGVFLGDEILIFSLSHDVFKE